MITIALESKGLRTTEPVLYKFHIHLCTRNIKVETAWYFESSQIVQTFIEIPRTGGELIY